MPHLSPRHLLGAELRRWRESRGLSAARLAELLFVSGDLVNKVEKAQRKASADLVAACDSVLDTGGALARLLDFAVHQEQRPDPPAELVALPTSRVPASLRITITAEIAPPPVLDDAADSTATGTTGARIYRFPPASRRSRP